MQSLQGRPTEALGEPWVIRSFASCPGAKKQVTIEMQRIDQYEEDSHEELVSILTRQEDWEDSSGESIEQPVSEFYL